MTNTFIIAFCVLIIMAYIFDLTTAKTKIPSVILLLILGFGLKQLTDVLNINVPNLDGLLPILGTIGLIVIVLEGSLELELNKSKLPLIKKSIVVALIPMMVLGFILAGAFYYYQLHFAPGDIDPDFRKSLIGAIPLTVISSAIAIPSAVNLGKKNKEFVTYESSLSDILGVLFFDFVFRNVTIDFHSFWVFLLQILIIAVVSFIATMALSYLLAKIDHAIKFIPIIILVILIYTLSKIYHLPALIFIMLFGLFLGNLGQIQQFKIIQKLKPHKLGNEVKKFHEILREGTFLIRVMFFLLFGFLIKTDELLNQKTFYWALGIVGLIFLIRFVQLKISKLPVMPLMFVAPRGLITILLFLYIAPEDSIDLVNKSLVIQVILLSVIIMMIGLMFDKDNDDKFFAKIKEKMAMDSSDAEVGLELENQVDEATETKASGEQLDNEIKGELLKNASKAEDLAKADITEEISSQLKETDQTTETTKTDKASKTDYSDKETMEDIANKIKDFDSPIDQEARDYTKEETDKQDLADSSDGKSEENIDLAEESDPKEKGHGEDENNKEDKKKREDDNDKKA